MICRLCCLQLRIDLLGCPAIPPPWLDLLVFYSSSSRSASPPLAPLNMHSGWGQGCMEVWTLGAQPRALSGLQCCCWKSILFPTKRHKGQELPHKCSQEECLCGWGGAWGKGETALLKAQVFSSFRALHSTTNAHHLRKKRRMAPRPFKTQTAVPRQLCLFRGRSSVQCTWLIKLKVPIQRFSQPLKMHFRLWNNESD